MYDVHAEMGWESLEICHVFTHSIVFKQPIYCSFLHMGCWWVSGEWLVNAIITSSLILKLTLIKK